MIIDLTKLESPVLDFDFSLAPELIDLRGEEVKLQNAVKVKGKLTKGIAQIEVTGEIFAEVLISCTRCLEPIEQKLAIPFNAEYISAEYYTATKDAELHEKDLNVAVFEGDKIDFSELVREQILLALPEQIFCQENCQGLCDVCGVNLNSNACDCHEKEIDPRWAGLQNLK